MTSTDDIFASLDSQNGWDEEGEMFGDIVPARTPIIEEHDSHRIMPHPETGKQSRWMRASGLGGVLSDPYTLNEWKLAMGVLGVSKNRDLYALANSEPVPTGPMFDMPSGWWMPWAGYAHDGMDAARSSQGAHEGTAVHRYTEQIEAGTLRVKDVPPEWRDHAENFLRVHKESKLQLNTDYMETLIAETNVHTTKQTAGVSGRLDRLRDHPSGWLFVDDTKTGRQAPKGLDEIAIQLAVYAHAPFHWRGDMFSGEWVPAPPNIHKGIAFVTHVPIDNPAGAEIIPVDIEWGWKAAQVVAWVLAYRNRAKRKNDGLRLLLSVLDGIEDYQG